MKNKVCIYARVSTVDLQDYDRQITDLKEIIYKGGYDDSQIDVFKEKISGYESERIELNTLLERANEYDCIYISEISRLGRNPSYTRKVIDKLMVLLSIGVTG